MKAGKIYRQLDRDFITSDMTEDWSEYMNSVSDFLCDNFKERSMGLVCDFTDTINKVYTAVFPSRESMNRILDDKAESSMLFVHHPSIWDIRKAPEVFYQMDLDLLKEFKKRKISIYNLHIPLDNFGKHSTTVTLSKELGIKYEKQFAYHLGAMCGVLGKVQLETVQDLRKRFQKVVGHKVALYNYGDDKIKDGRVAVVAGGGNELDILKEVNEKEANTFVTGITVKNKISANAHYFAKEHKINLLGGTHYSTEKFACISMIDYFKSLGLDAEFIEDEPIMEDM